MWVYYLRLVFRLAAGWQFVLRKARADRCSALSWMLLLDPSLVRRSRINWIWRSCIIEKASRPQMRNNRADFNIKKTKGVCIWSNIPASHNQPLPFVSAGSPRLLGCGRVLVWPPRLPSLFVLWWAPLCKTPALAPSSAICDGSHRNFAPSGWSLGNRTSTQ